MPKFVKFIISLASCIGVGYASSILIFSSLISWYPTIVEHAFLQTNYLFGPGWIALYILMGISLYVVWVGESNDESKKAIKLFALLLFLNVAWVVVFFALQAPWLALMEIVSLFAATFLTIRATGKVSKISSRLLYPYFVWVGCAVILNFSITFLNK
jgi:benzodiazapine receptor